MKDTNAHDRQAAGGRQTEEKRQPGPEGADGDYPYIYLVKNLHSSETFVCGSHDEIEQRTHVVTPTRYGMDLGVVLGRLSCGGGCADGEVLPIERIATESDMEICRENCEREAEAFAVCRQKIEKHQLDMKLVSAHYLLEEPKVLFFFTADSRVDFRMLVKDLVAIFRMRIELRQIGVRDESRVVGGMAVCGRGLCCHSLTDKLRPVSIKMAKEQNLSLNSMKISGPCGRLLCCLAYEYDFYHEEKKDLPNEGNKIRYGEDLCRISEVNILSKKVYVQSPDGRLIAVPFSFLRRQENGRWAVDTSFFEE